MIKISKQTKVFQFLTETDTLNSTLTEQRERNVCGTR